MGASLVSGSAERAALVLRPYQREAVDAVQSALERGVQRPLVVLPTGTGKTACFSALIARRGGSALVLAHCDELLRQAAEKIAIADPTLALGVGFVAAGRDDVNAPVVVGSVQTLARANRLARLPRRFDTVVVDEAHHASAKSYRRILEHLHPTPLILGVTATPARSDDNQLGDVWQEIVYQRGIAEMIRAGYLADVRGVRVGLEQVKLDQVEQAGGDFDPEALGRALEQASAPAHVLAAYRQHATGRKALVFAPTVALAHQMAAVFREAGISAEALDGKTPPEERRGILDRVHTGATRVCTNVGVLSEGVDVPSVDAVIMATPTRSQIKYAQAIGRGLRTFPDKEDCLVIDVVGVTERLDLQTLPKLFNLSKVPALEVTVTEALEREALDREELERRQALERQNTDTAAGSGAEKAPDGELRSRPVGMFAARRRAARRLRWLRHRECWLVSLGSVGTLALVPDGQRWRVLRLLAGKHEQLAGGVDLGYAHRSAASWPTPASRLLYGRKTGFRVANTERQRRSPRQERGRSLLSAQRPTALPTRLRRSWASGPSPNDSRSHEAKCQARRLPILDGRGTACCREPARAERESLLRLVLARRPVSESMTQRIDGLQQVQVADGGDQRSAPAEQRPADLPSPLAHPGELLDQLDGRSFIERWISHRVLAPAERLGLTKGVRKQVRLAGQVSAVLEQ
jgi:superfamily II DNA or RNA helicase